MYLHIPRTAKPTRRFLPLLFLLTFFALIATAEYLPPEDITFIATTDATEQRYILRLPPGFAKDSPHNLLIALHGHGSDRWQFAIDPRSECQGIRDVALEHHMIFVSPDYRAKTSWMGPKAETDVLQIIRDLKKQFHVNHIILAGGSMGGTSALTFTALHPDLIDAVVALNGTANHLEYENFQEAIAASFGGSKQAIPQEYKKRSAEYWPLKFTMPIAFTTGGKDTTVPPESVIRLANVIKDFNESLLLIHRSETGHTTNYEDTREALLFVLEHLSNSDPK